MDTVTNEHGKELMINLKPVKFILLFVLICVCYLATINVATLWDRDEPRFASSAVNMVKTGDYLVPRFNSELRPDKPVLVYWFMSAAIHIERMILPDRADDPPLEFTVRFFSVVAACGSLLLTVFIAKRLIGPVEGKWVLAVLAGCPLMFYLGTAATADSVTLFFLMLSMAVLCDVCVKKKMSALHVIALGIAAGFTMLAKGPIGLIPFLVAGIWGIWARKEIKVFPTIAKLIPALIIALLIFVAWAIPADRASGGELMKAFFSRHVAGRAMESMESHGAGSLTSGYKSFGKYLLMLPYYVPVIIAGALPWSVFLFRGFKKLRTVEIHKRLFLLSWIFVVLIGFSLAATKLPHYIIWLMPAIAIVCTIGIQQNKKLSIAFAAAMPIMLIGLLIAASQAERIKIAPQLVNQVSDQITSDTPTAMFHFEEPTLVYYLNRDVKVLESDNEVRDWLAANKTGIVFLRQDDLERIRKRDKKFGEVIAEVRGYNYPKGKSRTVLGIKYK